VITPGNETDFGAIEDDILDLCKRFKVLSVAHESVGRQAASAAAERRVGWPSRRVCLDSPQGLTSGWRLRG